MTKLRSDEGFSLSELVVVVGLLGLVLGAAWLSYGVAANGSRAADRESMTAREIAAPLLQCERLMIQQHNILTGNLEGRLVNPTGYLIAFNTDTDHDGHIESTIIEATADGRLVLSTAEAGEHALESFAWSTMNRNVATSSPLFTFYNAEGQVINDYAAVSSDARSVKITIVTEYGGREYRDSRDVTFRNR